MGLSAPNVTLHAVLVSVEHVGVLITGEAGTGKSCCVLKLLLAGHKLVSDDVVQIARIDNRFVGMAPGRFKGPLAIRGPGIVDGELLFGELSIIEQADIDVCIELRNEDTHGISYSFDSTLDILGIKIPKISIFAAGLESSKGLTKAVWVKIRHAIVDDRVFAAHDAILLAKYSNVRPGNI